MRYLVPRLEGFGTTIFAEMSALAARHDAINLGQGFPDSDGPPQVIDAAVDAMRRGRNQYAPGRGVPALRSAIARHQRNVYDIEIDPDSEVLVTTGATEGIAASILAFVDAGDEVVVLEPYYDSYAATIAMAGGVRRPVRLRGADNHLDVDELSAAVGPRTRVMLINTPHNPTGRVLSVPELDEVARLCCEHDLIAVCDEVYEHLTFDRPHVPLSTRPGMRERTVTLSSAGKTFSVTGWKVGWATGPPRLIGALTTVKQFMTFVSGTPFQDAIAVALDEHLGWVDRNRETLRTRRDRLVGGLQAAGFRARRPEATYFVVADISSLTDRSGLELCRALPTEAGVAAVPLQAFVDDPASASSLVRFAFCKDEAVLDDAIERLATWGTTR